jgi:endoglucanase
VPPPDPDATTCVPFHTADAGDQGPPDAGPIEPDAAAPPQSPAWPDTRDGLALELALDGDFIDSAGQAVFTALRPGGFAPANRARGGANQAYGPTGQTTDNGARALGLNGLPTANGLTFEGWFLKAGNNGSGTLFGFGDAAWGTPTLAVRLSWGTLQVFGGAAAGRLSTEYGRPEDCWHHVAVVFPPGFEGGGVAYEVYLDGERAAPTAGGERVGPGLFGASFNVGLFTLADGARMAVDEVRVWTRALSREELTRAATPQGDGPGCRPGGRAWEPGPRCVPQASPPPFRPSTEVRVLTDEWVALWVDPMPWLIDRYVDDCATYLDAMERNRDLVPEWWTNYQYAFAWADTRLHYTPALLEALDAPLELVDCAGDASPVVAQHPWVQAVGELSLPRPWRADAAPQQTVQAENDYLIYARLPRPLSPGETVALLDPWGYEHPFTYDPATTRSWALKVDQLGYPVDAPKHAYLAAWVPAAGPLDLSAHDGGPFEVVDEADGSVALSGVFAPDVQLPGETGEQGLVADFSALARPGRYHLRVQGVGRSVAFTVGDAPLAEAFYTYARGLYHNRCGALTPDATPWARGDAHQTFRGGFPPLAPPESSAPGNDYSDHTADGWGFTDADGAFVAYDGFAAVARTITDEHLPDVTGGWHDAGDFDRRSFHLRTVEHLAETYLANPAAFTDGQLDLPAAERANGRPDLLDEAVFGLEVWRAAQTPEGGVGVWIEATSHPLVADPGLDPQPYYLALPTRNGTLIYARAAALLSRALRLAGDIEAADLYLGSGRRAYAYGTDPLIRVAHDFTAADGSTHHFIEAPAPSPQRVLWALTELWLASGEPADYAALDTPAQRTLFNTEVGTLWWRGQIDLAFSVALDPDAFPAGWGETARNAVVNRAELWLTGQRALPYRRLWYAPDHPYFGLRGWGNDQYIPARDLALAWHVTAERVYRDAALEGLSFLHGNNPMGRVHTTGLGRHFAARVLHLPAFADALAEPPPGIPLYGPQAGVPHVAWEQVYGYVTDGRADPPYPAVSQVMLPPSLAAQAPDVASLRGWLGSTLPGWRRFVPLERTNVPTMEFTVWETTGPAVMVTGLLLPPGAEPGPGVRGRPPRSAAELRASVRVMP